MKLVETSAEVAMKGALWKCGSALALTTCLAASPVMEGSE